MSHDSSKIIAFNYFGGKFTYLDYLYSNFPEKFTHLVELFGGSAVVSLNYRGRVIKTINEINEDVTNFFEVLRNHENDLVKLLLLTPCSETEYNNCWEPSADKIEQARRFYVRVKQSFFGLGGQRKNKGWHMAKIHVNSQGGETVSRWNNAIYNLYKVAHVLRSECQIMSMDFEDCINRIDHPKAFFYGDPPYPKEVRKSFHDYKFEFSDEDHRRLADRLHHIEGLAMVSSYESDLYDEIYSDWYKIKFPVKKNNIRSGEVQEIIYTNYDPRKRSTLLFSE
ncbi:DNA adenine methylase [Dysgonomonas macrotermitis]|uniref:DNA adenine methylase n=1 Tax=Dysgonomonas macrotermitis TaxID=1346286 RepID=A0A1M4ULL8_9BACT|nr:DNA adenine methylase [Dysgonomonas macrotermitis]SHE57641.1 DNA adenine methylase [Dysgonomonas macrotermitis]